MRSRTSSSNMRVWRKDMTRFAPIWVEYSVFLLVILYFIWVNEWDITAGDSWFVSIFAFVNAVYGFIVALGLFGYLSDPRECSTVHAFPIRREKYFFIHLFSGFLMALVPNALFCLLNIPVAKDGSLLFIFGGMMLEFVCFYGLAIFSIFLTGRKFAAATVYALLNWLSVLVMLAINAIYLPQLPGVELNYNAFFQFCPVLGMSLEIPTRFFVWAGMSTGQMEYLVIYAILGVVLMVLSLLLYRRRKLEYAGDFLAVKWLTPVLLFAFSVACGCVLSLFGRIFDEDSAQILLMIGLLVGYFSCQMLIRKSVKVFHLRSIGGAVLTAAIVLGSLFLTAADPLDRVHYVPGAEEVAMVEIAPSEFYFENKLSGLRPYHTEDPAVMADMADLHRDILATPMDQVYSGGCYIRYHLKNGQTILRSYKFDESTAGLALRDRANYYFSQPEAILNISTLEELEERCQQVELQAYTPTDSYAFYLDEADQKLFMETFFRDCREGNMVRADYYMEGYDNFFYVFFVMKDGDLGSIEIPFTSEATRALCTQFLEKYDNAIQ